ncbi:MAG: methylenetetrahydrofolate reductase [NAD(P)H] [Eubacteriales bacterium]
MKISSIFKQNKTIFSLEVFPPKKTSPINTIYDTLDKLKDLDPDFISVTYGAGGNIADTSTCDIASDIKKIYNIEPLAHLTCVNSTKEEVKINLDRLNNCGIENIMALRGDVNPNVEPKKDFKYASELVAFIKQNGDFNISGACYPEGHVEAKNLKGDILNLKKKVDTGVSHLISQLFFDNKFFYDFVRRAKNAGINVPIEAGIMPVVNKKQIERMVTLCGASLPPKFTKMMQRYEYHEEALRDAGIAYAIEQIVDLLSHDVDGIHLYTMNNANIAKRISESVHSLIKAKS